MEFNVLMSEVKSKFNEWLEDDTMIENYCGNEESMKADFLKCIQGAINSNHAITTHESIQQRCEEYHDSMEGF